MYKERYMQRSTHIKEIVHHRDPMGCSNPIGRVGADQRIGNTMNATDRLDFIGIAVRSTSTTTAIPNPIRIAFVMPHHLRQVGVRIHPHTACDDGQTGVKVVGRQHIDSITNGSFINPEDHVFKGCFTRQLPASECDGVVLAHFLRVRSPKSSSFGCRNCQTTGIVRMTVRPMVTQIAVP